MALTGKSGVGLPTILLHESEALLVTIELKDGTVYRGLLDETEDSWNMLLRDAVCTKSNGKQVRMEAVYIKGCAISFVILPDFMTYSPMFKRISKYRKLEDAEDDLQRGRMAAIRTKLAIDKNFGGGRGRGGGDR
jgi:small nuclear ribonucleoprotein D3